MCLGNEGSVARVMDGGECWGGNQTRVEKQIMKDLTGQGEDLDYPT